MTAKEHLAKLVSFKTVTPNDDGIVEYCSNFLKEFGFQVEVFQFGDVFNLYAKKKTEGATRNVCFAGHLDVVPALGDWTYPPFELTAVDGKLYGRGANDMKGGVAAVFEAIELLAKSGSIMKTDISVMLTLDEEIMSSNGMSSLVDVLIKRGEKVDLCILAESCSNAGTCEYIKIGCRGSMNVDIISRGNQWHVSIAEDNHIHRLIEALSRLSSKKLDDGSAEFPPSTIQVTSIDVGNDVRNIVPTVAVAKLNIRFGDRWTSETLMSHLKNELDGFDVMFSAYGNSFISVRPKVVTFLKKSVGAVIGHEPGAGTEGGNSDALVIRKICDVVEIGTPVRNAHIVDEHIMEKDLATMTKVYKKIVEDIDKMSDGQIS